MNISKDRLVRWDKSPTIGNPPQTPLAVQLQYILPAHLFAIITTMLFGLAVRPLVPGVSTGIATIAILLITGTGWALHTLIAAVFLPHLFTAYHVSLTSIMWRGVLPLFPVILLAGYSFHSAIFATLCVAISSTWMIFQHIHHIRVLHLSQWWTVLWYALLVVGAGFWFFIFWENM